MRTFFSPRPSPGQTARRWRPRRLRLLAAVTTALTMAGLGLVSQPAPAATAAASRDFLPGSRPAASQAPQAADNSSGITQVCAAPQPGHATCMALKPKPTGVKPHRGRFATAGIPAGYGYGPSDLQAAYNLPSATAGSGKTVTVVDAYNDPDIASDLATYRAQAGLPACTTASGCFQVLNQDGQASPLPADAGSNGWDVEESLDVDMVSAVCPLCDITLIEANSDNDSDMFAAEDEAVALGGKYVSDSWAECEFSGETADDQYFDHPGVVIAAASGDDGYDNYLEDAGCNSPSYPAASPYVTAVGGTSLTQDPAVPRGWTETTWSPDLYATGSGCSLYEPKPSWQTDSGCANRMTNDVSADADPATGAAIYDSYSEGGWLEVGGTSEATPIIAATYALAGTPAAGTNPASYPYANPSGLNDVTSGTNYSFPCTPSYFCTAGPGYDGPTGLGTPDGVSAFTDASTGTISGTVTDATTGQPIPDAQVDIGSLTTSTGSDGSYTLPVTAGTYTVTAGPFGYASQTVTGVTVSPGQTTTQNFALTPLPAVTVSGTVTDGSGQGWPLYARVDIAGDPAASFTNPMTGQYSVSVPVNTSYSMTFTPLLAGYQDVQQTVDVGSTGLTENVAVPVAPSCSAAGYSQGSPCVVVPGGLVEGFVSDLATGDPVNGAQVQSVNAPSESATTTATGDPANPGGFYYLFSSQSGSQQFTASAAGYSGDTQTVTVTTGSVTALDFQLGSGDLVISPASVSSTQELGATTTTTLSITNDGDGAAQVQFSQLDKSFQVLGQQAELPRLASPDAVRFSKSVKPGPASVRYQSAARSNRTRTGTSKAATSSPRRRPARAAADSPDWQPGDPLPQGLTRYAYAQCPDQPNVFYVISGVSSSESVVNTTYRYDASSDTWTTLAPIPAGQESASAACLDDQIYVMGGGGTDQMYVYDIATNSWSAGAALPDGVEGAVAGAYGEQVYLIGGDNDFEPEDGVYDQVLVYDVPSNSWSYGTPMPVGASNPGGVQVGQYIYVAGGWGTDSPGSNLQETERYDMSTGTWQTGPAFTPAVADFALSASGSALYALGGDSTGGGFFDLSTGVYRLDLSDWPGGSWQNLNDPLPAARTGNEAGFCTTALTGGENWSIGGLVTSEGAIIAEPETYYRASGEGCAATVPWLSESPAELDIPPGGTVSVTVTLSATTADGVTQPGTYTAGIVVTSPNTSQTISPVDVTLNVTPPRGWGEIAGTLNGEGCTGITGPLRGVVYATATGYSYTLLTPADGEYAFWAPSSAGRFSLTASADGWIPVTTSARITSGKTTTVNFTLRPASC